MKTDKNKYIIASFVYLREACGKDANAVYHWKQDPLLKEMALGHDHSTSIEAEKEDIANAVNSPMQEYLIICLKKTDQPIGYIRVNWMETNRKFAWLRFSMGEERGKGYMKDALRAFLGRLFETGVHRVDAEAYEINIASLKLMDELGFVREGIKREAHFDGGKFINVIALGLLKADFDNIMVNN